MSFTARELFARLLKCEAEGEGESGMKAVASVVMNRVHAASGQYSRTGQGDLRKVITESGEFTCLLSKVYGEINPQTVWASSPEQIHYAIADWALAGNIHPGVAESSWYYNPFNPNCSKIFPKNGSGSLFNHINNHCFYYPTALYYKT